MRASGILSALILATSALAWSAEVSQCNAAPSVRAVCRVSAHKEADVALSAEESANIKVYKSANRAVVNIASIATSEDIYFNIMPREGLGSGTIISQDGYILTNYHVIESASAVRVTLFDGASYAAVVVGSDPSNDLAVLKIGRPKGKVLATIPLGDSSQLEVGRRVLAIGNPFGFDRTLTTGIVSSLGRTLKTDNGQ